MPIKARKRMNNVSLRSVMLTGASTGIGLEIARALNLKQMDIVALTGPSEDNSALCELNGVHVVQTDFRKRGFEADIQRMLSETGRSLDVLINNAAIFERRPLASIDHDLLTETFSVNVFAPILLSRVFDEFRTTGRVCHIVNIASDAAIVGSKNGIHYSASKGALISLTKSLAKHFRDKDVCVNAVIPGVTRTRQSHRSDNRYQDIAKQTLTGRLAEPTDIAGAVMAILSGHLDYMTGGVMNLTGGRYLW